MFSSSSRFGFPTSSSFSSLLYFFHPLFHSRSLLSVLTFLIAAAFLPHLQVEGKREGSSV
ncbi:hypothetical protein Tsubulata_017871 [Turnera subulata]|uniref:Uncharacterized protein n=1 Tax=Turnera subulata TaxID=218843 RepID=A0A9Q0JAP2_9ROSI|nr:hypothetical protein Tsubulata_017871 [Turnera subulata]